MRPEVCGRKEACNMPIELEADVSGIEIAGKDEE